MRTTFNSLQDPLGVSVHSGGTLTGDAASAADAAGTEGAALPHSDVLKSRPEAGHWLPLCGSGKPRPHPQGPASSPEAPPPNPPPPRAGCVLPGTHFFSERTPRLRASSPACAWAAASSWSWDSCSGPGEGEEKAGRPQIWWAGTAAVEGETVNTPAPAPHTLTALCQLRSADILRHSSDGPPPPGPAGAGTTGTTPWEVRQPAVRRREGSGLTPVQGATCAAHSRADPPAAANQKDRRTLSISK